MALSGDQYGIVRPGCQNTQLDGAPAVGFDGVSLFTEILTSDLWLHIRNQPTLSPPVKFDR